MIKTLSRDEALAERDAFQPKTWKSTGSSKALMITSVTEA